MKLPFRSTLFAILLCACFSSGCSDSAEKKIVGKWRLSEADAPEGAVEFECLADRTMTLKILGTPRVAGTWMVLPDQQLQFVLTDPSKDPFTMKGHVEFSDANHLKLSGDDDGMKGTFTRVVAAKPGAKEPPAPVLGSWKTGASGGLFNVDSVEFIYRFKEDGSFQRHITSRDLNGQQTAEQVGTWTMDGETLTFTYKGQAAERKLMGQTAASLTWILGDGTTEEWTRIGDAR